MKDKIGLGIKRKYQNSSFSKLKGKVVGAEGEQKPRPKTRENWKNPVILTTTRRAFFLAFPAVS